MPYLVAILKLNYLRMITIYFFITVILHHFFSWLILVWHNYMNGSLNLDKTCYSIFGPNHKDMKGFKLYINSKKIERVECCKYLGILIDSDLKWQDHINYVHNKLIKFTSILHKIRTKLPEEILRMIYFAFVHSHLSYGIGLCANTTSNHLSKLNVLHNRLLRIVQKKSIKHIINNDLYKSYFTLPSELLHQFNILLFMHNYVHHRNKLPVVFSTYFEENKVIHKYNTRQKDDFHIYAIKSEIGKGSIKYKGKL